MSSILHAGRRETGGRRTSSALGDTPNGYMTMKLRRTLKALGGIPRHHHHDYGSGSDAEDEDYR